MPRLWQRKSCVPRQRVDLSSPRLRAYWRTLFGYLQMITKLDGFQPDLFYTSKQVAEVLGVSSRTVEGWRATRTGPAFVAVSHRMVRYRGEDVLNWLATFRTAPGAVDNTAA
jgi:predicted DNA-binding transcriptional regulator AlpA